jgi:hypothetical protein
MLYDKTKDLSLSLSDRLEALTQSTKYSQTNPPIKVKYKNWTGEIGIRTIIPNKIFFGHTIYHPKNQWLMDVWDVDKDARRTYAMMDILEFIKED